MGFWEKLIFFPKAKWIVNCDFTKIKVKVVMVAYIILTDGSSGSEHMD